MVSKENQELLDWLYTQFEEKYVLRKRLEKRLDEHDPFGVKKAKGEQPPDKWESPW